MTRRIATKSDNNATRRSQRVLRSIPAENAIDTGAARVATSGPRGGLHLALRTEAREGSVELLNQLLADTMSLRDLYKKHHWQVGGPLFYQLHLLFDKHFGEQAELVDEIAERIRTLGGISVAMAADVAELTRIPRPPFGRESAEKQIERLLQAHELVLQEAHAGARESDAAGDDGTNDLIVSSVIRTNELQTWFIGEHLSPDPGISGSDGVL